MRIVVVTLLVCFSASLFAMRDPTQPPGKAPLQTEKFVEITQQGHKSYTLTGILYSGDRRVATINGKYLVVGEEINGAKVIAINKDNVQLKDDAGVTTLELFPLTIKQYIKGN